MMLLRRIAYLLIAASIGLALPFWLTPWWALIGLFGGRLYLLSLDPTLVQDRRKRFGSILLWATLHIIVGVTDQRLQVFVAFPLLSLQLIYWLMTRFSSVEEVWTNSSRRVTTGLMMLAGVGMMMLDQLPFLAYLIAACILITVAHIYHAFAHQNGSRTLAAHWVALTLLQWIGVYLGSAMLPLLNISPTAWLFDTPPIEAGYFAVLAVLFGMGNQITADMRGENRRITGLSAYWLVTFGSIMLEMLQSCVAVVRLHILGISLVDERFMDWSWVEPFTRLGMFWVLAVLLGWIIYLVQFIIRRPKF
jgi:hypothetical protein